jgi:hypothetical protein
MKNVLRLTAVPVLLASWGLGQAPSDKTTTTATTTEGASIKGCLAGSAGSYSLTQDGSPQSFKITTSAVNLKPHVGHDVELTGKRVSAAGFGVTDSTLAVTTLKMISDHCAAGSSSATATADPTTATLAAPAATVSSTTVSSNASAGTASGTGAAAGPATATVATPTAASPAPATAPSTPAAADPATATSTIVTSPATTSTPAPESVPQAAATTTTATVASQASADPSAPVMAGQRAALPNTPAPSMKTTQVTGKLGADGKTFVGDSDGKSWTVTNPEAVKGHEGHHVALTAHVDADTNQVNVVSLKMAK